VDFGDSQCLVLTVVLPFVAYEDFSTVAVGERLKWTNF